ncbi:MAG: hypothetical protein JW779_11045 [Candidatus Thorarchaeota archaeon]|nr:hypothetical protein [Candidatus Thorarchaeota archaeon]
MEDIVIRYWSPHGRQEETKFQSSHSKIDLVMRAAQRVDLQNITNCTNLEVLDLSNNMLDEIDLSPLSMCSKLVELRLKNNHLTHLNLWPLVDSTSLKEIDISNNRIHGLDLTPIFLKSRVRMDASVVVSADYILRFLFASESLTSSFHLIRPDGAPWTAPPVIIWNTYVDLSKTLLWRIIYPRIESVLAMVSKDKWFGAQRGLLEGIGIGELAGYDGNPNNLLDNVDSSVSFEEARHMIFDNAVELLDEQIENNGPTLFLDIEHLKRTRASKLIPHIVERRKREIEEITIQMKGSKVFLHPLLLTYYGYSIMKATGSGLITDSNGFNIIKNAFRELDIEIITKKVVSVNRSYLGIASKSMYNHVVDFFEGRFD